MIIIIIITYKNTAHDLLGNGTVCLVRTFSSTTWLPVLWLSAPASITPSG